MSAVDARGSHLASASPDRSPSAFVIFAATGQRAVTELTGKVAADIATDRLFVVSEFPPPAGRWIPFHPKRAFQDNLALCRDALRGEMVSSGALLLDPQATYGQVRLLALLLTPRLTVYLGAARLFESRRSAPGPLLRFTAGQLAAGFRRQLRPGGGLFVFWWRLKHPSHFRRPIAALSAWAAGWAAAGVKAVLPARKDQPHAAKVRGVSVVVPSRDGRELLQQLLPGVMRELAGLRGEVIVVDNGSTDGTADALRREFPDVRVEVSAPPLSFAEAVNRGIKLASYSHVCLLNNDMVVQPGFFHELIAAFETVPDLFCATAQIFFPPGIRREETGKAVKPPRPAGSRETSFPLRCEIPVSGENLSYVLYGSGGCSLFDAVKLHQLGLFGEMFKPAYVEDLDVGFRGWQRGWPTVYVADAHVIHYHRSTTSRYYTPEALELVLDVNYFRFLMRAVSTPRMFLPLWREATWIVNLKAAQHFPVFHAIAALSFAGRSLRWMERPPALAIPEEEILGLGSGAIAVFSGAPRTGRPVVVYATPYLPFPLSHGGAVRMFNLMSRAGGYDRVLVSFVEELATPPRELLDLFQEVLLVRRDRTHLRPSTDRPDMVEEFDQPSYRGALRVTCRKYQPAIVQIEFTHMAQYADVCGRAKKLLVEHDVTLDLYRQLVRQGGDWETRRQYDRWRTFEPQAWTRFDCVVTMSEQDRKQVTGTQAVCLPNGVDVRRFQPDTAEPEGGRILFLGAFQHLPNLIALEFFLYEVWPLLRQESTTLHVIAGRQHEYHLERYSRELPLRQPRVEVEGFVADVRPAYQRAAVVVVPLLASAGTNIKVLEALAMGKAVVSTAAGVNGLDLQPGTDFVLADTGPAMAEAIRALLRDPERRAALGQQARRTAVERYDWDQIARRQNALYETLAAHGPATTSGQ